MIIDEKKCVGCGNCIPYCPMGAIYIEGGKARVNDDECVECSTCYRILQKNGRPPLLIGLIRRTLGYFHLLYDAPVNECPTAARIQPQLDWPRSLRAAFSDPRVRHESTGGGGRGTEEIKTNDVTGRLKKDDVGFVVELGRPGTGTHFRDIEKVAMALAETGVIFEPKNPVTFLIIDVKTGKMKDEILSEKVLSAIIECRAKMEQVPAILKRLESLQTEVETVFSLGISCKCNEDGSISYADLMRGLGYTLSLNGKTNLGLGRPDPEQMK